MTPKHLVSDVLDDLAQRLDPIIQSRLEGVLQGLDWTVVLSELDKIKGGPPKNYSRGDLQMQLRMLTERLGDLKFPFDDHQRTVTTLGNELRIVRNDFAHGGEFTWLDAWRAADFGVRLVTYFSDTEGVESLAHLRADALPRMAEEQGIALATAAAMGESETVSFVGDAGIESQSVGADSDRETEAPQVHVGVTTNAEPPRVPAVGSGLQPFEPWQTVIVGPPSVIDELPKKDAKMRVRAVATEIVAYEGPIELERLTRLTAAAFDWSRLTKRRLTQIAYQIRQIEGVNVDQFGFVWPSDIDAATWSGFRPQSRTSPRAFTQVSPHEVANALIYVTDNRVASNEQTPDHAVLALFGRAKSTQAASAHLALATALAKEK